MVREEETVRVVTKYITDDGVSFNDREMAELYEASLSPFGKMRFPYSRESLTHQIVRGDNIGTYIERNELDVLLGFANLAPLIAEWRKSVRNPATLANISLAQAFDAACEKAKAL
jgi:hypothetical protein